MAQPSAEIVTRSNAEVVRELYEAFAQGDVPAVLARFSEDIAWHVGGRNPLSADYTGHDDVVGFLQALGERSNGTFSLVVHDILDNGGDTVMALVTENGDRNGARLADAAVHVWRLQDGKATSFRCFTGDDYEQDAFWS